MPFIPVPNTVMVELYYTQDAQQMENTLYFSRADTWDATEMTALADVINQWVITNISPLQNNTVAFRGCKVTDLTTATSGVVERLLAVSQNGGSAAAPLPNGTSLAIKFLTGGRGRSSRGRNYIVGLGEDQVNGNFVSPTVAQAYVAAYNLLNVPANLPTGVFWVVVSRHLNKLPRTTGIAQDVTGAAITDTIIDSQRRRLPGRGR